MEIAELERIKRKLLKEASVLEKKLKEQESVGHQFSSFIQYYIYMFFFLFIDKYVIIFNIIQLLSLQKCRRRLYE